MKRIMLLISILIILLNASAQNQTINGNLTVANTNNGGIRIGKIGDTGNLNVAYGSLASQYNLDFTGYRDNASDQIGARISALRFNRHLANSALVQKTGLAFYTNPLGWNTGTTDLLERMRITPEGNVGIGITNPTSILHVNGTIRGKGLFLDYSTYNDWMATLLQYQGNSLSIGNPEDSAHDCNIDFRPGGVDGKTLKTWINMYIATGKGIRQKKVMIHTQGNSFFNGGNIGIGTENPQSKLDVRGKITAEEIEIKVTSTADFVFKPDYNLIPLSEVESFIKENRHLPEIPSEKEMIENGINVNEMQIKLLQKIEELTLYMIEQDKKIERLEEQLNR